MYDVDMCPSSFPHQLPLSKNPFLSYITKSIWGIYLRLIIVPYPLYFAFRVVSIISYTAAVKVIFLVMLETTAIMR